jgi:hypothetical protein
VVISLTVGKENGERKKKRETDKVEELEGKKAVAGRRKWVLINVGESWLQKARQAQEWSKIGQGKDNQKNKIS